jgi:hypothetical protein
MAAMINETITANVPMMVGIRLPFINREVRHAQCPKCGLTGLPTVHRMKTGVFCGLTRQFPRSARNDFNCDRLLELDGN